MSEFETYAIRFRPRAMRDIDAEATRIAEIVGDAVALDWLSKLESAIKTLQTLPRRFPHAAEEDLIERGVRQMLFRRTPNGPAWRIFFTVEEDDDGRVVRIRHIRHAASPLTENDLHETYTDT